MVFIHPRLGEEVESVSGHYVVDREERLEVGDRQVLYFVGYAVFDTSCCGAGGCGYAFTPGYLEEYKYGLDDKGRELSRVTPVSSEEERTAIREAINARERVSQVNFV